MSLSISQIPSVDGPSNMYSQDFFLSQKNRDRSKNKETQIINMPSPLNTSENGMSSSLISSINPVNYQLDINKSFIDE